MKTILDITITTTGLSFTIEHNDATGTQLDLITAITAQTLDNHFKALHVPATQSVNDYIAEQPTADQTPMAPSLDGKVMVAPGGPFELQTPGQLVQPTEPPAADKTPTPLVTQPSADSLALEAAAIEKIESQHKRIESLRETVKAQDQCIADLKQQLANTAVFIAEPPTPAPELVTRRKVTPTPEIGGLPVVEPEPAISNGKAHTTRPPATAMSSLAKPERSRLGWDEFDQTVRSELRRLAPTPGVMVDYKLWNEMRDPKLPEMLAIIRRYGCDTAPELAAKLGMEPPLGRGQAKAEGAQVAG